MQKILNAPAGIIQMTPFQVMHDTTILLVALVFNALMLSSTWTDLALAIGGAMCGAVTLAYFRRDKRKVEQIFKVLTSTICGLVLGTVLSTWLKLEDQNYTLGMFFLCGLLSLVMLRALLAVTERNAVEAIKAAIYRVLGVRVADNTRRIEKLEQEGSDADSADDGNGKQ